MLHAGINLARAFYNLACSKAGSSSCSVKKLVWSSVVQNSCFQENFVGGSRFLYCHSWEISGRTPNFLAELGH